MIKQRIAIAALSLSALGFVSTVGHEGWGNTAIRPVPGDVPTYGAGSTTRPDGSPVQMGDRITVQEGIKLAQRNVSTKESVLKGCITGYLYQHEYDAFVDLAYNVGPHAVCRSSIPRKVADGNYTAACLTILDFKKVQGRDCFAPENAKFCGGIATRRKEMTHLCLTGEYPK